MSAILSYQLPLRQQLLRVIGNVDYLHFEQTLERISELIDITNLDQIVILYNMEVVEQEAQKQAEENDEEYRGISYKRQLKIQQISRQALRCTIGRYLLEEPYREFSYHLADSPLLQRFCSIDTLDPIQVPSKSTLVRYEKMLPEEVTREMVTKLVQATGDTGSAEDLGMSAPIDLDVYFVDTTCLKANIHFPVDWVLLRDATRTLMKAVVLIRKYGLKHRMQPPAEFIKQMNRLCIEMTHARTRSESKKTRKKILRLMKLLMKKIRKHAANHREVLLERWNETELTEKQVAQIVKRLDGVLEKLPAAIRQAHERIIGERLVKNKDKILSLYEDELQVIVRGKAGASVEFGNTLLIAEQSQGVIVDWKLYRDGVSSEPKALVESLKRARESYAGDQPNAVVTDRGFSSSRTRNYLEKEDIFDAICPKSITELRRRMEEERFREYQSRRGQTEGRIGILKNQFLGKPLRSKGFRSRELSVAWAVLAHNLWVLARLPRAEEEEESEAS